MTTVSPTERPLHRPRLMLALSPVATLALALSGCGDSAEPDVPDGFTTTSTEDGIQVSHPEDWETIQPEAPPGEDDEEVPGIDIVSPDIEDGLESVRVSIAPEITTAQSIEHATGVAVRGRSGNLPEYTDERYEIHNTGAEEAYRVDFSYTDPDGDITGEAGADTEGVDVVLLDEDNLAHQVMLSWDPERVDEDDMEQIVETVYLDG